MGKQRIYSAGESSRRITRKLTLANLIMLVILFALCIVFLNVFTQTSTTARTDEKLERDLAGFSQSHLSSESHSQRLPSGLLPLIFFFDAQEGYINPHPADYMVAEHMDEILSRNLPEGYSTQVIGDRSYRIYRVVYDETLVFWEQDESYNVTETVSFLDITSEKAMIDSLRFASAGCLIASILIFGVFSYWRARKTIVPINEAWEKQRQFAADTSHELRNPLASIQTNAELLLANPDRTVEQESKHVAAILDSSHHMASMISTLLTLARADADQDEFSYSSVDLSEVAESMYEQFAQIASARDIRVIAHIESGVRLTGDRERIGELLSILLDNAIRYTEPGGTVTISCTLDKSRPVVSIEDTGIGIADDEIDSVFQRFYRNDKARFINPEGTGLGLAIARWIVDRHDAELTVSSVLGEGTRFTITFHE